MNTQTTVKKEVLYQYEIQTSDNPYPSALVKNLKAKNIFRSVKYSYRFNSVEQRDLWVARFKKNVESWEQEKAERKEKKKNFQNPAKVGEILYSSWGYEQTNIDFYQVLAVKGKFVEVRELQQNKNETDWLRGTCTPRANDFVSDAPVLRKKALQSWDNKEYYIKVNECAWAAPWDGRPLHWTAYA